MFYIYFIPCLISFFLGFYIKKIIYNSVRKSDHKKIKYNKQKNKKYDFENSDLKMVFLVRLDLKMGAGKIAAQVAHAAIGLYDDIMNGDDEYHIEALNYWNTFGAKKIVLKCDNYETMKQVAIQAKQSQLPFILISDAGHTQIPAGSVTVLGIGPDSSEKINKLTGNFKLMH
jgi:PTH2 family peptidyl-tRNA hydrolase